nr:hydrolase [uncultured Sphaerochaeta sp.]
MDEQICCPPFDPKKWVRTMVSFDNQRFVKVKVRTFNHIPLNFGSVMTKAQRRIEGAGAQVVDNIALSNHLSRWTMEVLIAVDKEVPGMEMAALHGKLLSNVYEGPFKDTGIWCEDFGKLAKEKGFAFSTWYMWYTTCPKCAKKYGKNYVVILGQ